jgi:flagellar hook protein FlgE
MGFQQGLSGLNASSTSLDVIGNNVANASTVGFKDSRAEFADIYANSLNNSGASNVGLGAQVTDVAQQFTQGGITTTSNPLDIAINGAGFFRMSNNGAISYSRNGQFQLDKNGFIVNAVGYKLQGFQATNGVIANVLSDIQLPTSGSIAPQVTGTTAAGTGPGIQAEVNLDSRLAAPAAAPTFSFTDATTYNNSTSISVYDSLGNAHTYTMYFQKDPTVPPTPGLWNVYATLQNPASASNGTTVLDLSRDANQDGKVTGAEVGAVPVPIGTLTFSTTGTLTASTIGTQTVTAAQLGATGNNVNDLVFPVDFTGSTQFGATFAVNNLTQDGYTSGTLAGFNVGANGIIVGNYTNGITRNLGQVTLDTFKNDQGLQDIGNNQLVETSKSGSPISGVTPGSSNVGVLQASATEDSNVDLTAQLVNMIVAQRVYQANAQTIKVEDQILQTLVNLR